jgi:hypothetical protein
MITYLLTDCALDTGGGNFVAVDWQLNVEEAPMHSYRYGTYVVVKYHSGLSYPDIGMMIMLSA